MGERLQTVGRRPDSPGTFVENVCVDHGGFEVAVPEEFLDGANVVAVFQKLGRKGMAEGMAGNPLGDA